MFTCINTNAVPNVRMRTFLRADLIKTQNAFAHKIVQLSNALWVQKLSRCTTYYIYVYLCHLAWTDQRHCKDFILYKSLLERSIKDKATAIQSPKECESCARFGTVAIASYYRDS